MAGFRVILFAEAERNTDSIREWIAERSADGAARWYLAFKKTIEALRKDPERFPVAPESRHFDDVIRNATFRMKSGRTYRLLFTIAGNDVRVLYVRGPGQDWVAP